jgi:hypothetical protein
MLRLATALFGMTTSNVLLVTRGTANLMEKKNKVVMDQHGRTDSVHTNLPFWSTLPYIIVNVAPLLK